jgi:polyphosphate kinase 2 (PPK2 family)
MPPPPGPAPSVEEAPSSTAKVSNKYYEKELARLQVELVKQQEHIRAQGLKVVVIFEGRDAAGKGGAIQRITESLNPRAAAGRGPRRARRAREVAVVLPALRRAPARRR